MYDKEFLLALDKHKSKTVYARITALTFDEAPIETIEGRVTSGSITVDGTSAVRRVCSLSLVAQDFQYDDFYWGMNTKIKVEVGLRNEIDSRYPDTIWFPQGIYVLTSFNTTHSVNNFTISISAKDKMCLLNGEIGGNFESPIDFGQIEEEDESGVWTITKLPIRQIIRNMIHVYAGEPFHNIVINDLEDYGLELLEYRLDIPMYIYRNYTQNVYDNALLDGSKECWVADKHLPSSSISWTKTKLDGLLPNQLDMLVDPLQGNTEPMLIKFDQNAGEDAWFYVAKISYGQTAGYRQTELIYAGDLIANVGDTVTSILDKIKDMLVEFEYFYDLDGQFIFQKKQSFIQTMWSPIDEEQGYTENYMASTMYSYIFNGGELIDAFSNAPSLANMRNDFSVWGQRTTIEGAEIPVHMRYAIDVKPRSYTNYKGTQTWRVGDDCDWREIIYQMALDYYQYNTEDEFDYKVGKTGYEQYYADMEGFWRQLYKPKEEFEEEIVALKTKIKAKASELEKNDLSEGELALLENDLDTLQQTLIELQDSMENDFYYDGSAKQNWAKAVYETPELLNFWIDFLDTQSEISRYSTRLIGNRPKAVNETSITSIYFKETPEIIFKTSDEKEWLNNSAFRYVQIGSDLISEMFSVSGQGKSAKDRIDELIYDYTYCTQNITISCVPIYYLQPNTRIYLHDSKSSLDGDYVMTRFTIPLTYNGKMSITATKAAENII